MSDCVRRESSRFLFVLSAGGLAIGAVACSVNLVPLGTSDDVGDSGIFYGSNSDAGSSGGQGTNENGDTDASSGGGSSVVSTSTNTDAAVACGPSTAVCAGTCYGTKCVDIQSAGASSLEVFTLRGGYLYAATDPGGIMKMPIDGSAGTVIYTPGDAGAGEVQALTTDASNVYFVDGASNVWQMPIAGGTAILLASDGATSVAVDASSVYWVTYDTQTVMKVPIGGGTAVAVDSGGGDVSDLTGDGASEYWTNANGDLYKYSNGSASVLAAHVTPQTPYTRLAANAGVVAWSTFTSTAMGNDQVGVVAADGTATLISNAQSYVDAITLDASYVYWGEGDGAASVHRARIGTTTIELEAAGQGDIRTLAVDGTSLYYNEAGDVTVLSPK